jgi:hypothetical protein
MGWFERRGMLLRQLKHILEQNGWKPNITSYEFLRYHKGEQSISCRIDPYYGSRPTMTEYWVTFKIPLKDHPRSGERAKLRRFRTPIDKGINEAIVLSKIEDLFEHKRKED